VCVINWLIQWHVNLKKRDGLKHRFVIIPMAVYFSHADSLSFRLLNAAICFTCVNEIVMAVLRMSMRVSTGIRLQMCSKIDSDKSATQCGHFKRSV